VNRLKRSTLKPAMLLLMFPSSAAAGDAALAELFARKGVEGTMVLSSLKSGRTVVHNDERANRRFPAASTFNADAIRFSALYHYAEASGKKILVSIQSKQWKVKRVTPIVSAAPNGRFLLLLNKSAR
jgi:beta-lactamase class D